MEKSLLMRGVFIAVVLILLILDLGVFHKKDREIVLFKVFDPALFAISAFRIFIFILSPKDYSMSNFQDRLQVNYEKEAFFLCDHILCTHILPL